jgi:hypothetical protein
MKIDHHTRTFIRPALIAVAAVFSLIICTSPGSAQQTQPAPNEVQELKDRVKSLEETVAELKALVAAKTEARKTDQTATGEKVGAPATTTAEAAPTTAAPKPDDPPGESTFSVYGFIMLDAGYQFRQNHPDWFDVIRPTKLPSFRDEFEPDGKTYFGVRQSRFGVKYSTPTKYGELKTQFEFELFGTGVDAGQTTFRLRHAYGELGQIGAGQTWSPFMDIDVFPNSIEYWGPNGMVFFRNVQVRWMPMKGRNAITIALERPGASADQGRFVDRIELQNVRGKNDLPDLSGHFRATRDWGYFQVAGMLGRIKWVDILDDAFDLGGSDTRWGVNLTSNLKPSKKDVIRLGLVYGEGVQNYMNDADTDVGIRLNPGGGPRRPIVGVALPMLGLTAFLDHNWNKKFSSAIGYSMLNVENLNGQAPNAYHRGHYGLGNLLYYPVENVMIGGELQWGRRENFLDGFSSEDVRIQFSFKYNFAKEFKF